MPKGRNSVGDSEVLSIGVFAELLPARVGRGQVDAAVLTDDLVAPAGCLLYTSDAADE